MYIAGLDIGTTGCKISVYDQNAAFQNTYYKEYFVTRASGKHEINFYDVKAGVMELLKKAANEYKLDAIGITSFGETFAMLDENGNILFPSMLYTDPRGQAECDRILNTFGQEKISALTGVLPHPMYSISKIAYLKSNKSDIYNKATRILLGQDYIVYLLTGVAQIDYSLAARTGAFDIKNKAWAKEIFDLFSIDISLMSAPVPTGTVAGKITDEIKHLLNIEYDITVVNGAHDQVAAMIGSGIFSNDCAMDGTGTVECIPVIMNNPPKDENFYKSGYCAVPYINGKYGCYALSYTGGATLKWFRDNFAEYEAKSCDKDQKNIYAYLDSKCGDEPTGILVLPHFAGAATPYMDNNSKAIFCGITLETTKYDLYKALMEGTSYEIKLNFELLSRYSGNISCLRATGGGALSDIWLQIKADILNMDIVSLDCKEVGAAGTAAVAGIAVGAYNGLSSTTEKMAPVRKIYKPNGDKTKLYNELYKKHKTLYKRFYK